MLSVGSQHISDLYRKFLLILDFNKIFYFSRSQTLLWEGDSSEKSIFLSLRSTFLILRSSLLPVSFVLDIYKWFICRWLLYNISIYMSFYLETMDCGYCIFHPLFNKPNMIYSDSTFVCISCDLSNSSFKSVSHQGYSWRFSKNIQKTDSISFPTLLRNLLTDPLLSKNKKS